MSLLLLALLAASTQEPREERATTVQGLVLPVPSTWTRKDEGGVVYLQPPQIPTALSYLLAVFPPNKLQTSHWEAHKIMVKALLQQAQWTGGEPVVVHKAEGPGIFIKTEASGRTPDGQGRTFTLFTAAHDGTMEAILGIHAIDRNVVDPVLQSATFKEPPKNVQRPKIVEAYRRLNQRMLVNRDGGAPTAGSLIYDRIWLRSDGCADFSPWYAEGYAASPLPLKTDAALLNGNFGSWKEVDGKIHLLRSAGGPVEVAERTAVGLRAFGNDWQTMPRVDGLRLSGRWELRSPPEEKVGPWHVWIEFTAEGRFKTDGALKHVAFGDVDRPRPPEKGAGTYDVRDWTMFFKFDDGASWTTDFSTLGKEVDPAGSILLRTNVFPKSK